MLVLPGHLTPSYTSSPRVIFGYAHNTHLLLSTRTALLTIQIEEKSLPHITSSPPTYRTEQNAVFKNKYTLNSHSG